MVLRIITFPFRYGFALIKKRIGKLNTIIIEPLAAFGNEKKVICKARVVESYKQSKPSARKSYFQNILAALRRYAGSSVPDVRVMVQYHKQTQILKSDSEGIIECTFKNSPSVFLSDEICLQLVPDDGITPATEQILTPVLRYDSHHPRGIISDIDDTILISHATQTGRKFWLSVSKNAYTRRPFPGVSKFYEALTENGKNPVFYVSSSDWNLFDLIRDFLRYRNIPTGPILLKDLHINLRNIWKSGGGNHDHKLEKIQLLMELYPGMKFILIGDSGQHDPELYAEIMAQYPGRVEAVYIREITPVTQQRLLLLNARLNDPGHPDVTFVQTTQQAMEHALKHQLILQEHE